MVSAGISNKKIGQNEFYITGYAALEDSTMLILEYLNDSGNGVRDTAYLKKESFSFKGTINGPTYTWIYCKQKLKAAVENQFFIEPKTMRLSYELKNSKFILKVTGSNTNEEFERLKESQLDFQNERVSITIDRFKLMDSLKKVTESQYLQDKIDSLTKRMVFLNKKIHDLDLSFISSHPASFLSPYLLGLLAINLGKYPIKSASKLYDTFLSEVKNSYYGKQIAKAIETSEGGTAKDFSAHDLNGNLFRLSSFKHKSYVLLDFWATWCKPCRVSNLHLVELYNKYHLSGLEIVGIVNDHWGVGVEKLKKAIEEDKTGMFYQILQMAGSKNNISSLYSVGAIPVNILIDKDGTIIYRSEGDDDTLLDKKLIEIFK